MELQWPLILFTLFICWGAGTFGTLGVLVAMKRDAEIRMPALAVSFAAIAVGGIAVTFHLEHWERIFNGFGHLTSGITQELIAVVIILVVMVVFFVFMRKGSMPAWLGWVSLAASVLLVFAMTHSYLMASRPVWNSLLLYLYYFANAAFLGALTVTVLYGVKGASPEAAEPAVMLSVIVSIVQTIALLVYAIVIPQMANKFADVGYYFDPTAPLSGMQDPAASLAGFLSGDQALLFWGGAFVVGTLVPLALSVLCRKKQGSGLAAFMVGSTVAAILGSIAFRAVLYNLGFATFVFY